MPPPPSDSDKETKDNDSLVEQLCNIAGVSRIVSANLLEACNNNLEMAINMQMEGVTTDSNGPSTSTRADDVRAPIPQRQDILIDGYDQSPFALRGRIRTPRSVFDKFRDFEVETKRQEEALSEESTTTCTVSNNVSMKHKMKTLEDLFRPPLDLMFRGSFQSAREAGVRTKRWLMVNVQNCSEFPCQVLNRDVWSNSAVKLILQEHFIFWQIYHDSEDGQRYMTFYSVPEWPYVGIIDPRTGECLTYWHKIDALLFCELITEFLAQHHSLEDPNESFLSASSDPPRKKQKRSPSIIEADEAVQLEAAIKASLELSKKSGTKNTNAQQDMDNDNDSDVSESFACSDSEDAIVIPVNNDREKRSPPALDVKRMLPTTSLSHQGNSGNSNSLHSSESAEEESDNDEVEPAKEEGERWSQYIGLESDPQSKLMLRYPDGNRESFSLPSTSKLMALVLYAASKGFSNESYELVTNFPKRRLSLLDFDCSLKAVGLYPQETVFIQKR